MRLLAVAPPAPATVRDALRRHGWDADRAAEAAAGLTPAAVSLEGLSESEVVTLVAWAARAGLDCVTGDDWVLLVGSRARLAALGRPGGTAELGAVGVALGEVLARTTVQPAAWQVRGHALPLDRPVVLGVVNLTPDSFSDGGRFLEPDAALRHAERLLAEGADVLDLGAESTRPGRAAALAPGEEQRRLLPVLERLRRATPDAVISVDTVNGETAERALDLGVHAINDVTGLRHDRSVAAVCAAAGAGLILMHSRGKLLEIAEYGLAQYGPDPAAEVAAELARSVDWALDGGVARETVVVDPGLGFAKRPEHNWQVLNRLEALRGLGLPVLIGPSRKRFLGEATERPVDDRDDATAAACALGWTRGARLFRVHDVKRTRAALAVAHAWESA